MNKTASTRNDPVLTQIMLGSMNQSDQFIADRIYKSIAVQKKTGDIRTFGSTSQRIVNTIQGSGESKTLTFEVTKADAWSLKKHSLKALITDDDMDQLGTQEAKNIGIDAVTEALLLAREYAVANYMTDTDNYTNDVTLSGTEQWDDYTSSDPIDDLITARATVREACGKRPNMAIMGPEVFDCLINHPDLLTAARYAGEDTVSFSRLKRILFPGQPESKVEVLVGEARYESAKEGAASSMADLWGNNFIYLYVDSAPNPRKPQSTWGAKFHRGKADIAVKTWTTPDIDPSTWEKGEWEYDDVVLSEICGYLIKNARAAI